MVRGMSLRVWVTILALLVVSGAAFASPLPQGGHPLADSPSPLSQAWSWMVSLFDAALATVQGGVVSGDEDGGDGLSLQRGIEEGGMGIDPNGGW